MEVLASGLYDPALVPGAPIALINKDSTNTLRNAWGRVAAADEMQGDDSVDRVSAKR